MAAGEDASPGPIGAGTVRGRGQTQVRRFRAPEATSEQAAPRVPAVLACIRLAWWTLHREGARCWVHVGDLPATLGEPGEWCEITTMDALNLALGSGPRPWQLELTADASPAETRAGNLLDLAVVEFYRGPRTDHAAYAAGLRRGMQLERERLGLMELLPTQERPTADDLGGVPDWPDDGLSHLGDSLETLAAAGQLQLAVARDSAKERKARTDLAWRSVALERAKKILSSAPHPLGDKLLRKALLKDPMLLASVGEVMPGEAQMLRTVRMWRRTGALQPGPRGARA